MPPGNPGIPEDLTAGVGDEARLLRRLGNDHIAGNQRRDDLPDEDGDRKVPWADADEDAAAVPDKSVVLARRTRQRHGTGQVGAAAGGVIAAEVDRFADVVDGIGDRLSRFGDDQGHERRHPRLQERCGALQAGGALRHRRRVPGGGERACVRQRWRRIGG